MGNKEMGKFYPVDRETVERRSRSQEGARQGVCPRCGSGVVYKFQCRALSKCAECEHQFSDTSATGYRAHKLPVETLDKIRALYLGGMNARQISAALGINYRTAWARTRQIEMEARND